MTLEKKDNNIDSEGEIVNIYRKILDDLGNEEKSSLNPWYFTKVFSLFDRIFSG